MMNKKSLKKNITNLQTPPTKIKKRRLFFIALIFIMVSFYFDYLLNLNHYKPKLEEIIGKAINADVSINKVRLKLFDGPSINLKKVSVLNKANQSVYFQVDNIKCDLSLSDFFSSKKIHFSSISLDNPKIRIEKDSSGKFHLPGQKTTSVQTKQHDDKKYTKLFPKIQWLKFEKSTFFTDQITATSGTIEISYQNRQDKTTIQGIELVCQRFMDTYSITVDSLLEDDDTARIIFRGTIDLSKSKSFKKAVDIISGSDVDAVS